MVKWGNRTNYITLHDVIAELPSVGMILRNLWPDSKSFQEWLIHRFRLDQDRIPSPNQSNRLGRNIQSGQSRSAKRHLLVHSGFFFLPQKCVPLGCVVINSSHATLWRRVSPLDKNSKAKRERKKTSHEKNWCTSFRPGGHSGRFRTEFNLSALHSVYMPATENSSMMHISNESRARQTPKLQEEQTRIPLSLVLVRAACICTSHDNSSHSSSALAGNYRETAAAGPQTEC